MIVDSALYRMGQRLEVDCETHEYDTLRSKATEPAWTVVGDVGVTSSASSVPIICSWRIAVATRCSSSPRRPSRRVRQLTGAG